MSKTIKHLGKAFHSIVYKHMFFREDVQSETGKRKGFSERDYGLIMNKHGICTTMW